MFKKLTIVGLAVLLVVFFTIPAFAFADTDDEYSWSGEDSGQYTLDNEGNGSNPDTDIYCIDDATTLNYGDYEYTETDEYVIDVLQEDGQGGNFRDGIDPEDAAAAAILATTATGATDSENQNAMWDIIEGDTPPAGSNVEAIVNSITAIGEDFEDTGAMDDANLDDHGQLMDYLDEQDVNEVKVTLDSDPLVDENGDYNDFTATAIMKNPLVPEITDENKLVYWYILGGSYNVSFSETDLVTETTSTMVDEDDEEDLVDEDGDGNKADDHYGLATVPYFFYWWGEGYPEYEEMNVNIGACVDIDGDEMIDKSEADVSSFTENMQVVQTIENPVYNGDVNDEIPDDAYNSEHIVETEIVNDVETVVTDIPDNLDICEQEGGKVVVSEADPVHEYGSDVTYDVKVCEDNGFTGDWYGLVRHGFLDYRWEIVSQNYFERWECSTESRTTYITYGPTPLTVDCSYYCWSGCPCDGTWYYGTYPNGIWADTDNNGDDEWYLAILDRNYTYVPKTCDIYPKYDAPQIIDYTEYQRFVIENYSEPCGKDGAFYSAWGSFDLTKTETGSVGLIAVPNAVYTLTYVSGQTFTPETTVYELTTDEFGKASVKGLPWGTYELNETVPAPGYQLDGTTYTYNIGGTALFKEGTVNVMDSVTDALTPPSITTTTLTVAALTEEVESEDSAGIIDVLGIQELPFTGTNAIILFSGIIILLAGMAVLSAHLRRNTSK